MRQAENRELLARLAALDAAHTAELETAAHATDQVQAVPSISDRRGCVDCQMIAHADACAPRGDSQ